MKVLIDARLYGLENAGLGRYVTELIRYLSYNYQEFDFVVFLRKKYFKSLKLPKNWKKVCVDIRHYSLLEQIYLPSLIRRENPDLVHFPHFNVPIFYTGKFVVTIHDLLMHNFSIQSTTLNPLIYLIKRLAYKVVFHKAIYSSSLIITPSFSVKDEVLKTFRISASKVKPIYEGVSEEIAFSKLNIDLILKKYGISSNYVIYCGNAYPHKNLDFVLRVWSSFSSNKYPQLVLVLPRSVFRERIEKQVLKLGLQKKVRILDFVPDDVLASLMKGSLAYLFPSLSEGFGLPGLEALSVGTIVLASDIPVFKEIYKEVPVYFDPRDESSLRKALEKILRTKRSKRNELIKLGKEISASYSWKKMTDEIVKIYSRLGDVRKS